MPDRVYTLCLCSRFCSTKLMWAMWSSRVNNMMIQVTNTVLGVHYTTKQQKYRVQTTDCKRILGGSGGLSKWVDNGDN